MEPASNLGRYGRGLMITAGIILLLIGITLAIMQQLPDNTPECTATVTGFVESEGKNDNPKALVSYIIDGKLYENIELGQYEASWKTGDKVTIYYDPEDPTKVQTRTMTYIGWILMLASMPLISIGLFMTMSLRRRASKTPEEIAEDEEKTTAGRLKYKISSIVIPLCAGIPIMAIGTVFVLLEHNSVFGLLVLVLGAFAVLVGVRSIVIYFIIKYLHYRERKLFDDDDDMDESKQETAE